MSNATVSISRDLLIRLLKAHDTAYTPNNDDMDVIRIAVTPLNIVPRKETVVLPNEFRENIQNKLNAAVFKHTK